MFQTGDYMIYGNNGVCMVEQVGTIDTISGIPKDKLYYTLKPLYIKGSTIYSSVDNQKVRIRPLISKSEAMELIDGIDEVEILGITNERQREEVYKEAIATGECRELIKVIKTVYERRESRLAEGKNITNNDSKYFKMAQESLHGELAIVLDIEKEQVETFITEQVRKKQVKE